MLSVQYVHMHLFSPHQKLTYTKYLYSSFHFNMLLKHLTLLIVTFQYFNKLFSLCIYYVFCFDEIRKEHLICRRLILRKLRNDAILVYYQKPSFWCFQLIPQSSAQQQMKTFLVKLQQSLLAMVNN